MLIKGYSFVKPWDYGDPRFSTDYYQVTGWASINSCE